MTRNENLPLSTVLAAAMAEHGALRVFSAAVTAALHRRAPRPMVPDLPDYLRRDVGLPEADRPPPVPELIR